MLHQFGVELDTDVKNFFLLGEVLRTSVAELELALCVLFTGTHLSRSGEAEKKRKWMFRNPPKRRRFGSGTATGTLEMVDRCSVAPRFFTTPHFPSRTWGTPLGTSRPSTEVRMQSLSMDLLCAVLTPPSCRRPRPANSINCMRRHRRRKVFERECSSSSGRVLAPTGDAG